MGVFLLHCIVAHIQFEDTQNFKNVHSCSLHSDIHVKPLVKIWKTSLKEVVISNGFLIQ